MACRPYKTACKVHVRVDGRRFVVHFDADGNVLSISQRKEMPSLHGAYRIYDAPYWSARSHVLGSGNTLPKRIIAAALEKQNAATP